jgi:hypothetical protein
MHKPPSSLTSLHLHTPRHLRAPFQQLVTKRQFDRIMDVLLKEKSHNQLHSWFVGKLPHPNKYTVSTNDIEHTGETPLHRIAAVQPPGKLLVPWSSLFQYTFQYSERPFA